MIHCRPFSRSSAGGADPSGRIPPRSEIPGEYTWDLDAIFPSSEAWEESCRVLGEELERLGGFNGRLFESPETLLEFLKLEEAASERMGKIYAYAVMKSHEDTADAARQARADRAGTLLASYGAVLSFYRPEVLAAGAEGVKAAAEGCPGLEMYSHHFDDLLRTAEHVLGLQEEEILARSGEMARTPKTPSPSDERRPRVSGDSRRIGQGDRTLGRTVLPSEPVERQAGTEGRLRGALLHLREIPEHSRRPVLRECEIRSLLLPGQEVPLGPRGVPSWGQYLPFRLRHGGGHGEQESRRSPRLHGPSEKALGLEELRMYDLNVPLADEPETRFPTGRP